MRAVIIERGDADKILKRLFAQKVIDKTHKIISDSSHIYAPLAADRTVPGLEIVDIDFPERRIIESPIKPIIPEMLKLGIPAGEIPRKWVKLGDCAIINYSGNHETDVGFLFANALRVRTIYALTGRIEGKMRKPSLKILYGPGGDITHLENGVYFTFDPSRIMFSPGNVNVRTSMRGIDASGKIVFDMFAGIGYFSIPIAKYGHPDIIFASEINPESFHYLRMNIQNNKVLEKFEIFNRDCRDVLLDRKADIVIMGHFDSHDYIGHAILNIRDPGKIIMHHLVKRENIKSYTNNLLEILSKYGVYGKVLASERVKSYSPNIWHYQTTFWVSRSPLVSQ